MANSKYYCVYSDAQGPKLMSLSQKWSVYTHRDSAVLAFCISAPRNRTPSDIKSLTGLRGRKRHDVSMFLCEVQP